MVKSFVRTVKRKTAAQIETVALVRNAVSAPNVVQRKPKMSEAGKTVMLKARL